MVQNRIIKTKYSYKVVPSSGDLQGEDSHQEDLRGDRTKAFRTWSAQLLRSTFLGCCSLMGSFAMYRLPPGQKFRETREGGSNSLHHSMETQTPEKHLAPSGPWGAARSSF